MGGRARRQAAPVRRLAIAASLAVLGVAVIATPATAAAGKRASPAGKKVTVRKSAFGPMLWAPRRQALYIFQRDRRGRSRCYGACARAWPPLLTRGRPRGGRGVRKRLLGTVRRRGGARQVTYAGKPLYAYAHEGPGQVLCHNVRLHGGLWWVIGPRGKRRP